MARVTEKKFAAKAVRVWRTVQRLEKLKAEANRRGIYHDRWPGQGVTGNSAVIYPCKTKLARRIARSYRNAHSKLWNSLKELALNY